VTPRANTEQYPLQVRGGATAGSSTPRRALPTPPPTDPRMTKIAGDRYYTIAPIQGDFGLAPPRYRLDADRRAAIKVTANRQGLLYQPDGNGGHKLMNTEADTMFVMDGEGSIYAGNGNVVYNHTGFMAGGRVAGAGELTVINGVLTHIDNFSGHYHPSDECHQQVLARLREMQVDIPVARTTAPAQLGIRA